MKQAGRGPGPSRLPRQWPTCPTREHSEVSCSGSPVALETVVSYLPNGSAPRPRCLAVGSCSTWGAAFSWGSSTPSAVILGELRSQGSSEAPGSCPGFLPAPQKLQLPPQSCSEGLKAGALKVRARVQGLPSQLGLYDSGLWSQDTVVSSSLGACFPFHPCCSAVMLLGVWLPPAPPEGCQIGWRPGHEPWGCGSGLVRKPCAAV